MFHEFQSCRLVYDDAGEAERDQATLTREHHRGVHLESRFPFRFGGELPQGFSSCSTFFRLFEDYSCYDSFVG